jgi:hypothetical protein
MRSRVDVEARWGGELSFASLQRESSIGDNAVEDAHVGQWKGGSWSTIVAARRRAGTGD